MAEFNFALQRGDLFEKFQAEHMVSDDKGNINQLPNPKVFNHKEGDLFSFIFIDANKKVPRDLEPGSLL